MIYIVQIYRYSCKDMLFLFYLSINAAADSVSLSLSKYIYIYIYMFVYTYSSLKPNLRRDPVERPMAKCCVLYWMSMVSKPQHASHTVVDVWTITPACGSYLDMMWFSWWSMLAALRSRQAHVKSITSLSGWWFGTFFIFPYIGNNHPNWLIFFRGVQTTNQL